MEVRDERRLTRGSGGGRLGASVAAEVEREAVGESSDWYTSSAYAARNSSRTPGAPLAALALLAFAACGSCDIVNTNGFNHRRCVGSKTPEA